LKPKNAKGLVGDADRFRRRLAFINAAETLDELATPPNFGLHELTGDRKGTWPMSVYPYQAVGSGAVGNRRVGELQGCGCLQQRHRRRITPPPEDVDNDGRREDALVQALPRRLPATAASPSPDTHPMIAAICRSPSGAVFSLCARTRFSLKRTPNRFRQIGFKFLNRSKQIKGDKNQC
jgi:hypothetical protein